MPFRFERLGIPDVFVVHPQIFEDQRGQFWECYKRSVFQEEGIDCSFVQDNHSVSRSGVLRGLHFQRSPSAQAKLVRVTRGEVFDVVVDLRAGSQHYADWVGRRLTASGGEMLFVPEGFAHGFCVLSDRAGVHYKVSAEYDPEREGGILWDDPALDIEWPLEEPVLSERDAALPRITDSEPRL